MTKERHSALIIDDEPDIRELLEITLTRMQIACKSASDLGTARRLLESDDFDLCLTDMRLPDGNGVEFVTYMQTHYPKIPVTVITAHGNMETAITALKSGAFDFIKKQGPALRRLEQSGLIKISAREAPFFMAEKFTFHQVMRNSSAIDRDKKLCRPGSLLMDHPGNQFLAGTGFTTDVDRRLAPRQLGNRLTQILDRLAVADKLPIGMRSSVRQPECAVDHRPQYSKIHWLVDEVKST